jgi:hypothetical protein
MEHCEEAIASGFIFRKHNEISDINITTSSHLSSVLKIKIKISLLQAMEASRVARGQGSHIT